MTLTTSANGFCLRVTASRRLTIQVSTTRFTEQGALKSLKLLWTIRWLTQFLDLNTTKLRKTFGRSVTAIYVTCLRKMPVTSSTGVLMSSKRRSACARLRFHSSKISQAFWSKKQAGDSSLSADCLPSGSSLMAWLSKCSTQRSTSDTTKILFTLPSPTSSTSWWVTPQCLRIRNSQTFPKRLD